MRLSEAILLGSTVVKPKAGALQYIGEDSGCALGMAVIASGATFRRAEHPMPQTDRRTLNVEDLWGAWLLLPVARPCDCGFPTMMNRQRRKKKSVYQRRYSVFALPREMRIKDVLAHLFDYHIMVKEDWTLDRLTSWLQPLEPNEPAISSNPNDKIMFKPDFHVEDTEWLKTRRAFEAQMKAKRH